MSAPWHQSPGIHSGISNDEYHASEPVSNSRLSWFARSPMHYQYNRENPPASTPTMGLGSMVHAMLLEPETVESRFVIPPSQPRRSKADKQAFAAWALRYVPAGSDAAALATFGDSGGIGAADADRIVAQHVELVSAAQLETARTMVDRLRDHPAVQFLLSGEHETEATVVWQDNDENRARALNLVPDDVAVPASPSGLWLKSRPDILRRHDGQLIVADLKTCDNAGPNAFARSAYTYRYYVQAALGLDGLDAVNEQPGHFAFVCVESSPPHAVAVYKIDDAALELGRLDYLRNLSGLAECLRSDHWPAYSDGVLDLTLPGWAYAMAG